MSTAPQARPRPAADVREELLAAVGPRRVTAALVAGQAGVVAGMAQASREADRLGLSFQVMVHDGGAVAPGAEVARLVGSPEQVVRGEEVLLGLLGKPSGIATRTRAFVAEAGERLRVVSGGWKKMPPAMKEMVRDAVGLGGGLARILPVPFVYLDKNWVTLLGGVRRSLEAVGHLQLAKVLQVKGREGGVGAEACLAAELGAAVVFVDTGREEDAAEAAQALTRRGLRSAVLLAFGGGVTLERLPALRRLDLDLLDVGRAIVDAPLLDLRLDVLELAPVR